MQFQSGEIVNENNNRFTTDTFPKGEPIFNDKNKVFLIFDVDSPKPSYLHFLKINNRIVVPYVAPTPPNGKHHYILMVFDSKDVQEYDFHFNSRSNFNYKQFFHSDPIFTLNFYVSP